MSSYIKIPTWNKGVWEYTEFATRDEYKDFVLSIFKEPGKYDFNEVSLHFNEEAQKFRDQGYYFSGPMGSKDYRKYWDAEKEKCRYGAIFTDGKHGTFPENTTCGSISYQSMTKKKESLTFQVSGMHNTTWHYTSSLQNSTINMQLSSKSDK